MHRRALLSLALAAAALPGCRRARAEDVLRLGLANGPRNLDPRLATDAASERVNRLLYRRLVEFDAGSRPVPGLAKWKRLSPTWYRFHLGEAGRTFSDGSRLTSADVQATYASILDPATASPHRALLSLIDEIRIPDTERIDFRLRAPDALFPAYLGIGILPAARRPADPPPARAPVGSGPLRFLSWPDPGRVRLARRRDGRILELVTVKDPNVRVMKLLRGEIQWLQNDLPPELVDYLARQDRLRILRTRGVNFSYLGFNLEDPATGRREVRQAIAQAIDRAAILHYLFHDGGRLASGLFPPEHWAGAPEWTALEFDPPRARRLLAAAGYDERRPLRLTFKTSSDPFRLRLAAVFQAQLAQVGIDLRIQSHDWGTFFGDIQAGRFQVYSLTWVGIRTPDLFRYAFHSASLPPRGANRGRYRSLLADRLIETARAEPDLARQAEHYRQLQAHLLEDLPYVPLWYEDQVAAVRRELGGYRVAPDGNYDALEAVRPA